MTGEGYGSLSVCEKKACEEEERRDTAVSQWLEDKRYQAVLRATRTIAFEYDSISRRQKVSSFINEYLAGNYDGRMLSQVMLEDGIIHPDDRALSLQFKEKVLHGELGQMTLRLLSHDGAYRWYRMSMTLCPDAGQATYVGVITDVDEEVRQKQALLYRAEFDPLCGIFNKETFFEATQELLSADPDKPHFLIRFDIDRFKIINEMYSISEGDRVLRHIGQVTQNLTGPGETCARIGNDVFCMCVSRPEPEIFRLIEQLETQINDYPMSFQFVISMGILRIAHYDGAPVDVLCDRAAMAQRRVKGNYIQRYAFYEKYMSTELNQEHYITGCMRQALEGGEFQVYLQPKVDMGTGRVIGAEALARWKRKNGNIISPGDFIPLFERNGFILCLDEYIWEQTYSLMRRWMDGGAAPIPVSVNVSRMHLHDPEFCSKMIALSEKYQIPPHLIEMEITESAYTESPQTLYGIMDRLQEQGFVFSMDDFGSGYSSLNILKDIPVNIVKIDLHFLSASRRGAEIGHEILKGTIQLVNGIGLSIIAEGVERKEQVDFLMSVGCTHAQGYYYARPMKPEDFEDFLRKNEEANR